MPLSRHSWAHEIQIPTLDEEAIKGGINSLPSGVFPNGVRCASLDIVSALRLTQFPSADFYGPSLNTAAFSLSTQSMRTARSSPLNTQPFLANLVADEGGENLRRNVSAILKAYGEQIDSTSSCRGDSIRTL